MNKKIIGIVAVLVVCIAIAVIVAAVPMMLPSQTPQTPTGELDFSVSGSSDCLRFLNGSVPTFYVPFTIAANENWQLTINATKMPGGANGWTDVYVYEGYWDNGATHMCRAENLYPIINDIESADFAIRANATYTHTFSASTMQSYTVFFVVPPGGPATFHVTLKPA
jgi:hypothetical protein